MNSDSQRKTVLMCCSDLSYKGGMVTVVQNYLASNEWDEFNIRFVPTHVQGGKAKVAFHFAATYPKLARMFSKHEVDLVHLHVAERGSFFRKALIARSAKRHGIPVIFHHHAAEFMQFYNGLNARGKDYVRQSFELVDLNIVLSGTIKKQLSALFPKARFEVIENAVSTFSENPYFGSSRNIVFMGRVGDRKGTFDLIEAFANALPSIDKKWHLLVCGDGEIERAEDDISRHGLNGRAECLGWVSGEIKDDILRKAGVNILPSYNEGLPMSILEAMSFGVPTVSTRIAAIPEVINSGNNGILVDPGDIGSLTSAIVYLCNFDEARLCMSDKAFKTVVDEYSFDQNINRLKELYRTLC